MRFLLIGVMTMALSCSTLQYGVAEDVGGGVAKRNPAPPNAALNSATSGAGFVDLQWATYLGLLYLGFHPETASEIAWGGSWEWEEDLVDQANPNDSPGP